jgi:peptide/nickel transport system ATP-binding protein/peptide/nickel transport system permease protein
LTPNLGWPLGLRLVPVIRRRPLESAGAAIAAIVVIIALVGPLLAPHDPYQVNFALALRPPSLDHPLGMDGSGRDNLSRILYGARLSLESVAAVLTLAIGLGTLVGTVAALSGRVLSNVLMRVTDIALSLPALLLALAIAAALGVGVGPAVLALALAVWPGYARLVRSLVLETREREFVDSARALGVSRLRLVARHILPNSLHTLLVQATLDVSTVLLSLAGLSFVGAGAQPPQAEWGAMIADGRDYLLSAWWVVFFPGIALTLTAVGFNLLGDLLRSELDPTIRIPLTKRRHCPENPRPVAVGAPRAREPQQGANEEPLLSIRGLCVRFASPNGFLDAVQDVNLDIHRGERVGIVGESGSGKTATARSILGLLPSACVYGAIRFEGQELLAASDRQRRRVRGRGIGLVLQDALASLNPAMTVGDQITETLRVAGVPRGVARKRAIALLDRVGIANASGRLSDYPHQFSGGMRQRVMIAVALIAEPRLLIADEPTSSLDVRVQGQVLDLLDELTRERRMAVLLITHDLGIVAGFADRVAVMYAGRIVEECSTASLFYRSEHPYTWGLLGSIPRIDAAGGKRLDAIRGQPPTADAIPSGCAFHPRCRFAREKCALELPLLRARAEEHHFVACHYAGELIRPENVPNRPEKMMDPV